MCFPRIAIFGIFILTRPEKGVCLGGTQPMLLPQSSCVCIPSFRSVTPRVCLVKVPFFGFFHHHGYHFLNFIAHVLCWVKTYDHTKFQRNPHVGLARMMVQTQADISFVYMDDSILSISCAGDYQVCLSIPCTFLCSVLSLPHSRGWKCGATTV